ncbi:MAG TPA: hypothetical protein VFJ53_00125 [Solirubrobacterales bacterium]|nr:hypothetical protein [Solirubrobacterales bacterium]
MLEAMQRSRFLRRFKRRSSEREATTSETGGEAETGPSGAVNGTPAEEWYTRHIQEREQPNASEVWLVFATGFLFCAVGASLSAATLSREVAMRPSELWITTGGLALAAALCFLAHWDVNRGRKVKKREVKEKKERNASG